MDDSALQTGFDPSRRELCPDGACIGVIGADGTCRVCGKPSPNGPPPAETEEQERAAASDVEASSADSAAPGTAGPREVEDDSFDPMRRELCPDGACIGVIGPDGTCKVCGRPAE